MNNSEYTGKLYPFEYRQGHELFQVDEGEIVVDIEYEDDRIVRYYYLVYPDGSYDILPLSSSDRVYDNVVAAYNELKDTTHE